MDKSMPNYPRPPIVEAAFDIRFSSSLNETSYEKAVSRITKLYPHATPVARNLQLEIKKIKPKLSVAVVGEPDVGTKFEREAADCVLQLYPNQLIFSRLALYEGWDDA